MSSSFTIESEGDLEVIILRETHSFLASLMHPDIFEVTGKAPNQNVAFKSHASFNLFLVWITEFYSEGIRSYRVKGKYSNMSLCEGIKWFCAKYPKESKESGLQDNFATLEDWVNKEHEYNFYCGDIDKEFEIYLSRKDLFNFCSNITKHNIFRLNIVLTKLKRIYKKYGYDLDYSEVLSTLDDFEQHIREAMRYYASYLIELLGYVFLSLNEIICKRYKKQGTNDASKMKYPKNISSDIFRELYSSTLVFQSYERNRIKDYTPTTWKYLKKDYIFKEETG
jgi:hypothetical protein